MPKITFLLRDGSPKVVDAPVGASLLRVAHDNDIDLEGACGGSLACATCHLVVDEAWYPKLPQKTTAEEDMLDLAFGLTETSRLGCQIKVTEDMDGMVVALPQI
jgi:ferredoxin, 2Fe-2S